jgi:hypothetical protein
MQTDRITLSYDQARELIDNLWSWSENFSFPSPASLFLDLIGYSEKELGERLCSRTMPQLGWEEQHRLGWALLAHAHRPADVLERVTELLADETEA